MKLLDLNKPTFILLTSKQGKTIIRPSKYKEFFKRHKAELHCTGSKELCQSLVKLYS